MILKQAGNHGECLGDWYSFSRTEGAPPFRAWPLAYHQPRQKKTHAGLELTTSWEFRLFLASWAFRNGLGLLVWLRSTALTVHVRNCNRNIYRGWKRMLDSNPSWTYPLPVVPHMPENLTCTTAHTIFTVLCPVGVGKNIWIWISWKLLANCIPNSCTANLYDKEQTQIDQKQHAVGQNLCHCAKRTASNLKSCRCS